MKRLIGLLATGLLVLAACGDDDSGGGDANAGSGDAGSEVKTLQVAVLAPFTGDLAYYGEEMLQPVEALFEQLNADGGIEVAGVTYELEAVSGDTQGRPEQAVAITRQLMTRDGVEFFIGPAFSGSASAVEPLMSDGDAFFILASAVALGPTDHPTVFRNQALLTLYNEGILGYLENHPEYERIAVLTDKTHTGLVQNTGDFVEGVEALDRTLVANDEYTRGDTDFRALITSLQAESPDIVVWRGYPAEGVAFRKQARELGASWDEIWSTKIADGDLRELGTDDELSGIVACYDPGIADQQKQGDERATAAFDEYGEGLSVFFDNVWDAAEIMVAGLRDAESAEPAAVAAAVEELTPEDVDTYHDYLPQADGLLFENHEIQLEPYCAEFGSDGWQPTD